ncbi:hypothetical protein B0H11DRAFT_2112042, partial [Mycena galericulata]
CLHTPSSPYCIILRRRKLSRLGEERSTSRMHTESAREMPRRTRIKPAYPLHAGRSVAAERGLVLQLGPPPVAVAVVGHKHRSAEDEPVRARSSWLTDPAWRIRVDEVGIGRGKRRDATHWCRRLRASGRQHRQSTRRRGRRTSSASEGTGRAQPRRVSEEGECEGGETAEGSDVTGLCGDRHIEGGR